jgi:UDP-perosamine 4-acetyltransferase
MPRVVVIGGGGHAKVAISVLKKSGFDIAGYTDHQDRGVVLGVPYLGKDDILQNLGNENPDCDVVLGVGKIDASPSRFAFFEKLSALGFYFPVIVSPGSSINEDVQLSAGTVVFDGVIVNSGSKIGRMCILNTNSTVDHDCLLGDNVHIAPGATLSGGVNVGNNTMIGTGAAVIHSVTICAGCLIGAGSTVVEDLIVPGIYVGSPARRIK